MIEEFYRGKAYADSKGFRLYLGLEVTLMQPHYADWLLYGITEEFLRSFGVKSLEELPELSAVQIEEFKEQAEAEVALDV